MSQVVKIVGQNSYCSDETELYHSMHFQIGVIKEGFQLSTITIRSNNWMIKKYEVINVLVLVQWDDSKIVQ